MAYYFSASWCGPCKAYKPYAIPMLREFGFDVIEYDIDEVPEIAHEHGIMSVPTIIIGDERISGAFPAPKLRERLTKIG